MADPVLFLSRPAREGLTLIHASVDDRGAEPVWRLLLTAMFAAGAALSCAVVVIFGAPGGDPGAAKGDPVHMAIMGARR
jgi:hypothetical protein